MLKGGNLTIVVRFWSGQKKILLICTTYPVPLAMGVVGVGLVPKAAGKTGSHTDGSFEWRSSYTTGSARLECEKRFTLPQGFSLDPMYAEQAPPR